VEFSRTLPCSCVKRTNSWDVAWGQARSNFKTVRHQRNEWKVERSSVAHPEHRFDKGRFCFGACHGRSWQYTAMPGEKGETCSALERRPTRGSLAPMQSHQLWTVILSIHRPPRAGAKYVWRGLRLRYGPLGCRDSRCPSDVNQPGYVGKAHTTDW
jgi:hypothetical protein